jgi:hypothetical protein
LVINLVLWVYSNTTQAKYQPQTTFYRKSSAPFKIPNQPRITDTPKNQLFFNFIFVLKARSGIAFALFSTNKPGVAGASAALQQSERPSGAMERSGMG